MISGNNIVLQKATMSDLDAIKRLADKHRSELGFVLRPSLEKSIYGNEIIIAMSENTVIGFVHYHHRRDKQTTLYHIAVSFEYRLSGIGGSLIRTLRAESEVAEKTHIQLKCPTSLPSNIFYQKLGFELRSTETGKERKLNIWHLELKR